MGDDISLGSVKGCHLWSLGNHGQHTEMQNVGVAKIKTNTPRTDVITH